MSNITALLAEDVDIMRRLLKNALSTYSCNVIAEVENGNDVAIKVQESAPDIVFLDINMPGKNGLEVLQEIRKLNKDIFIAMVSGFSSFENVKAALEYGANGFIVKPFTTVKIKEMIDKYHSMKQDGKMGSELISKS